MAEEDALQGDPEIQSGTETLDFVKDEGKSGDEGEQDNAPDSTATGAATDGATGDNPNTDAPDL